MQKSIKYSWFNTIIITCVLSSVVCLVTNLLINTFGNGYVLLLFQLTFILFFLTLLLVWVWLFLIPLLKGKAAIQINEKGIYIESIATSIDWKDIRDTEIMPTKHNYIIKIFTNNKDFVINQELPFINRLALALNDVFYKTPFAFLTANIQGKARDIYNEIKSMETKYRLEEFKKNNRI